MEPQKDRTSWHTWAATLSKYGLGDMVSWILESFGSLKVLGAHVMIFTEPFLNRNTGRTGYQDLLNLLEDPAEGQAFVAYLKGIREV